MEISQNFVAFSENPSWSRYTLNVSSNEKNWVRSKTLPDKKILNFSQIGHQQQTHAKKKVKGVSFAKADTLRYEHTPVIVFGIAKIKSIKLTAMLSGLKLEGEICGLQSSLQYKVI